MTERRALGWLWLGVWLAFVAVAHGNLETTDAGFTMHAARNLWRRGDSGLRTAEQGGELIGERMGAAFIADSQRRAERGEGHRIDGQIGRNGLAYVWFPMGHVFCYVPFVAVGEALTAALPDAEQRFAPHAADSTAFVEGTPIVLQATIALLEPSLCIATSIVLLFLIARALGADRGAALVGCLATALATPMFALGREQLSDGPGLTLLLAALWPMVRLLRGPCGRRTALFAGAMAGAAVLVRYQTALTVVTFGVWLAVVAARRRHWQPLLWFALGGLPFLGLFLATNWLRYGDPLDTGYPKIDEWFVASPLAGIAKILFGAGRGVMWLSPLLWLVLPVAVAGRRLALRGLALLLFATPLAVFMGVNGWQGGQCWANRYVTPGVVVLLAIVLPQTTPWRRWPRTWWLLLVVGLFGSLTSIVAPVRGVQQLTAQAIRAEVAEQVAAGELDAAAAAAVDPADVGGYAPRFSPLVANWRYAFRSHRGGFEGADGRPLHGAAGTIGELFDVAGAPADPGLGLAPMRYEDRCGRHLWWRLWSDLYGVPGWMLCGPVLLLAAACLWRAVRHLGVGERPAASESPTLG